MTKWVIVVIHIIIIITSISWSSSDPLAPSERIDETKEHLTSMGWQLAASFSHNHHGFPKIFLDEVAKVESHKPFIMPFEVIKHDEVG